MAKDKYAKQKRHETKKRRQGICRSCSNPAWPYAYCTHHRFLRSVAKVLRRMGSKGILDVKKDKNGHASYKLVDGHEKIPYRDIAMQTAGSRLLLPRGMGNKGSKGWIVPFICKDPKPGPEDNDVMVTVFMDRNDKDAPGGVVMAI